MLFDALILSCCMPPHTLLQCIHVQSHQRLCCHLSPNQRIQARILGNAMRGTSIESGRNIIGAGHRRAWMTPAIIRMAFLSGMPSQEVPPLLSSMSTSGRELLSIQMRRPQQGKDGVMTLFALLAMMVFQAHPMRTCLMPALFWYLTMSTGIISPLHGSWQLMHRATDLIILM